MKYKQFHIIVKDEDLLEGIAALEEMRENIDSAIDTGRAEVKGDD